MAYKSSDVSAGDTGTAEQYNNLREDAIDHIEDEAASVHGSTSAKTASKLVHRDASGRAKVQDPSDSDDIATKKTVTDHAALTNPHSATSAKTASRLMLRDASGRSRVADPSHDDDVANKGYVDELPFAFGTASRARDAASGDQEIAHGLGRTPKFVKLIASHVDDANGGKFTKSSGISDGSNNSCIYTYLASGYDDGYALKTDDYAIKIIQLPITNNQYQQATVSLDGTNITLTWVKGSGSLAGNEDIVILWEAYC